MVVSGKALQEPHHSVSTYLDSMSPEFCPLSGSPFPCPSVLPVAVPVPASFRPWGWDVFGDFAWPYEDWAFPWDLPWAREVPDSSHWERVGFEPEPEVAGHSSKPTIAYPFHPDASCCHTGPDPASGLDPLGKGVRVVGSLQIGRQAVEAAVAVTERFDSDWAASAFVVGAAFAAVVAAVVGLVASFVVVLRTLPLAVVGLVVLVVAVVLAAAVVGYVALKMPPLDSG